MIRLKGLHLGTLDWGILKNSCQSMISECQNKYSGSQTFSKEAVVYFILYLAIENGTLYHLEKEIVLNYAKYVDAN